MCVENSVNIVGPAPEISRQFAVKLAASCWKFSGNAYKSSANFRKFVGNFYEFPENFLKFADNS